MNELTDNQIRLANSPVVPAGVISLRCLTTSILFEYFAVSARQRIMFFVPGEGCFKSVWSNCRFCFSWSTISFGLHDGDTSDSATLRGRASVLSSLSKEMERVGLFHSFKTVNLASLTHHCLSKNREMKFLPLKVPIAPKNDLARNKSSLKAWLFVNFESRQK